MSKVPLYATAGFPSLGPCPRESPERELFHNERRGLRTQPARLGPEAVSRARGFCALSKSARLLCSSCLSRGRRQNATRCCARSRVPHDCCPGSSQTKCLNKCFSRVVSPTDPSTHHSIFLVMKLSRRVCGRIILSKRRVKCVVCDKSAGLPGTMPAWHPSRGEGVNFDSIEP